MSYRDDQAALAQRLSDLEARLATMRKARQSLSDALTEEQQVLAELDALRKQSAPTAAELKRRLPLVQRIEVASPCTASWDAMVGDEKKRFCAECQKHVYNVSAMTAPEAEALLLSAEGKLCVRLYRRADGTVLTQDCPVGLRRSRRRRLAAAVAVTATLAAGVSAMLARIPHSQCSAPRSTVVAGEATVAPVPVQGGVAPTPTEALPELGERMIQGQTVAPQVTQPMQGGVRYVPSVDQGHSRVGRRTRDLTPSR